MRDEATRVDPLRAEPTFATARVGYAYGPDLFTTRDGGRTWQREEGPPTLALTSTDGYVFRVIHGGGVDDDLVQRRPVGSSGAWEKLAPRFEGYVGPMVAEGRSVFIVPTVAIGQAIYRSLDGGHSWSRLASPCAPEDTAVTDATVSRGGHLAVLCTDYPDTAYVRASSDDGTSFGPDRPVPVPHPYANIFHMAAASADVLLVSDDADTVQLSADAGRTWRVVLRSADPMTNQRQLALSFQDARTAHVIEPPDTVASSTDQGRHWTIRHLK